MALKGLIENQFVGVIHLIEWTPTTAVEKTFKQTRFKKRVALKNNSPKSGISSAEMFCEELAAKSGNIQVW